MAKECFGSHRYFVADVATVENEGKVTIIVICTACGDAIAKDFYVASGTSPIKVQKGT